MLALISHARSGSTYLMRRLQRFGVFRVYFEIFHFNDHTLLEGLGEDATKVLGWLGLGHPPYEAEAVRKAVLGQLEEYLDALEAVDLKTVPAFKVFPYHLDPQRLETVIGRCDELLFLTRNLLHAHISVNIAQGLQQYSYVNTSSTKVEFSAESFMNFAFDCVQHHDSALAMAESAGVRAVHMHYEDFVAAPDRDAFLAQRLASLSRGGWKGQITPADDMRRQDLRGSALQKVSNPQVLEAFVHEAGLAALLDSQARCDYGPVRAWLRANHPWLRED